MSVPSVSFEFFPSKTEEGNRTLFDAASRLGSLSPEFVSVTYRAGGSTREPTARAVSELREYLGFDVAPHLTRVDASKEETPLCVKSLSVNELANFRSCLLTKLGTFMIPLLGGV